MTKKKNRPAGATAKRSGSHESENITGIIITEIGHGCKKKMRAVGIFVDPDGRWPAMPVVEMPDETPERWNAKVAEQRRKREERHCEEIGDFVCGEKDRRDVCGDTIRRFAG